MSNSQYRIDMDPSNFEKWISVLERITNHNDNIKYNEHNYVIINRGRFSEVRKYLHKVSKVYVAAKLICKNKTSFECARFEVNLLRSLEHQAFPTVFDTYETLNANIIVMEW